MYKYISLHALSQNTLPLTTYDIIVTLHQIFFCIFLQQLPQVIVPNIYIFFYFELNFCVLVYLSMAAWHLNIQQGCANLTSSQLLNSHHQCVPTLGLS